MKVTNNQQQTAFGTNYLVCFEKKHHPDMIRLAKEFIVKRGEKPIDDALKLTDQTVLVLDNGPLTQMLKIVQRCAKALEILSLNEEHTQGTIRSALKILIKDSTAIKYKA